MAVLLHKQATMPFHLIIAVLVLRNSYGTHAGCNLTVEGFQLRNAIFIDLSGTSSIFKVKVSLHQVRPNT